MNQLQTALPRTAAAINDGVEKGVHYGAQICIWHDGEAVINTGAGTTDGSNPQRADTVNLWLSAGKPIGAAAAILLVREGVLDLDAPVADYWPGFGANGKGDITTRHILTHTAGLETADQAVTESDLDRALALIKESRPPADWKPGQRAGYSTFAGWQVIGQLVHILTCSDYALFTKSNIIDPLDMSDSSFRFTQSHLESIGNRISPMYVKKGGELRVDPQYSPHSTSTFTRPGGGLRSTASDMVRFYRMLLGLGELDGVRILESEEVGTILSPQRTGMVDHTFGFVMDWGLGVMFNNYARSSVTPYGYGLHASPQTFGHGGSQSSTAFADPEHSLAVAFVFNSMPGGPAHERRLRSVCSAIYEDLELI